MTTPAYLAHFGLSAAPFSKEVADADLWLPTSKTAVVEELCEALGITGDHNWLPLQKPPLRILRGDRLPDSLTARTARIGITQCVDWPLRWVIRDNPFVSRARPSA